MSYLYDFKQLVKFVIQLFVIQLSWICMTVNSVNRASCLTQGMQVQNCVVVIRKMNLNHISSTSCALDGTRIHGISRPNYCYCHLEDIIGTTRVGRVWIPHVAGCYQRNNTTSYRICSCFSLKRFLISRWATSRLWCAKKGKWDSSSVLVVRREERSSPYDAGHGPCFYMPVDSLNLNVNE